MVEERLRGLIEGGKLDQAIEHLHRAHAAEVARYVRSRQRRAPEASTEDVCQEVWIAARRAIEKYDFTCTPRTWLFGIAKRRVIDHWRGKKQEEPAPDGVELEALLGLPGGPAQPSTPHSRAVRKERGAALERVLARFEPDERELLELAPGARADPRGDRGGVRAGREDQYVDQTVRAAAPAAGA